jgi:hypothetical protein
MKTLNLTIVKQYFDMVGNGKPEEYRQLTDFWFSRLLYKIPAPFGGYMNAASDIRSGDYECNLWRQFTHGAPIFETFDRVLFANGGHFGNVPKKTFECKGIEIREGNPEWGAEPGVKYFVIKLGERIK